MSYPVVVVSRGSRELIKESFPKGAYIDVLGLCKVATVADIEAQGWSLNPGRYVGVAEQAADDFEFAVRLQELNVRTHVRARWARGRDFGDLAHLRQKSRPRGAGFFCID